MVARRPFCGTRREFGRGATRQQIRPGFSAVGSNYCTSSRSTIRSQPVRQGIAGPGIGESVGILLQVILIESNDNNGNICKGSRYQKMQVMHAWFKLQIQQSAAPPRFGNNGCRSKFTLISREGIISIISIGIMVCIFIRTNSTILLLLSMVTC